MIRLCNSFLLLFAVSAFAGFDGFPLANNTNAPTWYEARELYNPIGQLYSGVVERCSVTTVASPEIIETWIVSAGSSNEVETVVDGGVTNVYTNIVLLTQEITTTNQLAPFEYTCTDPSGTYSATGFPYLTHYFLDKLDDTIDALIPKFLAGSLKTNGNFNAYFASVLPFENDPNIGGLVHDFPTESKAGLFDRTGIGFATNLTTNVAGYVTGGTAYYTRQPPTTRNWLIAELHAATNGWTDIDIGDFDIKYFNTNVFPIVTYIQGGTNSLATTSLTITGDALNTSNQTLFATSEIVSVSSTTTLCTVQWFDITSITTASTINNTGDVFAISYTNEIALYGDRPYRLYSSDLDERWTVLTNLVDTQCGQVRFPAYLDDPQSIRWNGYVNGRQETIAEAKSTVEDRYEEDFGVFSGVRASTFIKYDFDTWMGIPRDSYIASADRRSSYLIATNIVTNATMTSVVAVYADIFEPYYQAIGNNLTEFDDHGNGYLSNQKQLLHSEQLTLGEVAFSEPWFGAVNPFPNWPTTNPTNVSQTSSRGYSIELKSSMAQTWDFEYK